MSLYSLINSFSPYPQKSNSAVVIYRLNSNGILRKCIYSHNIQSLDYYGRLPSSDTGLIPVIAHILFFPVVILITQFICFC